MLLSSIRGSDLEDREDWEAPTEGRDYYQDESESNSKGLPTNPIASRRASTVTVRYLRSSLTYSAHHPFESYQADVDRSKITFLYPRHSWWKNAILCENCNPNARVFLKHELQTPSPVGHPDQTYRLGCNPRCLGLGPRCACTCHLPDCVSFHWRKKKKKMLRKSSTATSALLCKIKKYNAAFYKQKKKKSQKIFRWLDQSVSILIPEEQNVAFIFYKSALCERSP